MTSGFQPFPPGGMLQWCSACGAVQKLNDARWRWENDEIYRSCMLYASSGGLEPKIFDDRSGGMKSRSTVIIDAVAEYLPGRAESLIMVAGVAR